MNEKALWLSYMDAIKRTIETLPDDVSICGVHFYFDRIFGKKMIIHILHHPDVSSETGKRMCNGGTWCERSGVDGVTVAWIEEAENEPDKT